MEIYWGLIILSLLGAGGVSFVVTRWVWNQRLEETGARVETQCADEATRRHGTEGHADNILATDNILANHESLTQVLADANAENTHLRDRVQRDTEFFEHVSAVIPTLVTHLQSVAKKTESSALELGTRFNHVSQQAGAQSEALVTDIAQIVMAMQFQDFTRQKIEYINEALLTIQARSQMGDTTTAGGHALPAWPTQALEALERLDAGELVAVGSEENVTLF